MQDFFFSGCESVKIDRAGRFVVPQEMRLGLVEAGRLEFTITLGFGGCLAIYRQSDIARVVARFKAKSHEAKYQRFFTLFFSTLHKATCDEKGRVLLPTNLKDVLGLSEKEESQLIVAGAYNKIELWTPEKYQARVQDFLGSGSEEEMTRLFEEAFSEVKPEMANEKQEWSHELEAR